MFPVAAHLGWCPVRLVLFFSLSIQARQRHVAVRLVHVADDGAASALFDEAHAFPDEDRGAEVIVLGNASADGVVLEPRGLGGFVLGAGASGGLHFNEAVFLKVAAISAGQQNPHAGHEAMASEPF